MTKRRMTWVGPVLLGVGLVSWPACGGGDDDDASGSGSAPGGATVATGGADVATGGADVATGGADVATGGANVATGGAPAGGTGAASTTGGAPPTGGAGGCEGGPLAASLPDCEIEVPAATGDYHQDCVNVINAWRWQCQCLPPLERWAEAESCADQMAQYDYEANEAHAAFRARLCDPGGRGQCECPGWGSPESITHPRETNWGGGESCLEMMWHEVDNPAGEQGHYEAMSSSSHARVACGIYEAPDGDVWAVQNYDR